MKIINFSGASKSGKTTTMQLVSKMLTAYGVSNVILSEPIRDYLAGRKIEDLRNDPKAYFTMQKATYETRYARLLDCLGSSNAKVALADRAMTDVLFYLETYVDKQRVPASEFIELWRRVFNACGRETRERSLLCEFAPLSVKNSDNINRPSYIDTLCEFEAEAIRRLNDDFCSAQREPCNRLYFDLNQTDGNDAAKTIVAKIRSLL